jgi:hypothetical protein
MLRRFNLVAAKYGGSLVAAAPAQHLNLSEILNEANETPEDCPTASFYRTPFRLKKAE